MSVLKWVLAAVGVIFLLLIALMVGGYFWAKNIEGVKLTKGDLDTGGSYSAEERQALMAPVGAEGRLVFSPNVPYCEDHGLVYPPHATRCEIDRADLSVACPVDGTVRAASIQTCPACGTRFVLGAGSSPTLVVGRSGPPDGGAAIA